MAQKELLEWGWDDPPAPLFTLTPFPTIALVCAKVLERGPKWPAPPAAWMAKFWFPCRGIMVSCS